MTSAFVGGAEERVDHIDGFGCPRDATAEADHIGIIVAAGQARRGDIVDHGSPGSRYLVGRNGDTDPGAADTDTPVGLAGRHRLGHGETEHRIVDRYFG